MNYIPKMRPQLVRRKTIVKTNKSINIIVNPSCKQIASLNQINKIAITPKPHQPASPSPAMAVKPQKNTQIRKKKEVKYVTREINGESLAKIKRLKDFGKNKFLVIIGNGPSINQVDLGKFKNHPKIDTLSINKPDERVWPTTHWAFFDQSQMRRHEELWNSYDGYIFNSTGIKRQKEKSMQIKNLHSKGFSKDISKGLHIGRSSVYAAMQIAYWLGYTHIYIFGCDMNPNGINGQLHFYGNNPDVSPDARRERFKKESEHYDHAANILSNDDRSKYTFCSSENNWSFVSKFNKHDHVTAIDMIITKAEDLSN